MTRHLICSSAAGLAAAVFVCVLVGLDAAWKDRRMQQRAAGLTYPEDVNR